MEWINVNEKYLDYLRQHEQRIPKTNYGINKYKPFFGILFETEKFCYVTQVSHAQERHIHMKQQKDFFKIYDPNNYERLIAVVNLNYMFPVPKNELLPFDKSEIHTYRAFESEKEKSKYINLLDLEIKAINTLNLDSAAIFIYENKYRYPQSKIAQRCLDYKQLEEFAKTWVND